MGRRGSSGGRRRGGKLAALAVVALVAGTYLVASLIGRSGDPLADQAGEAEVPEVEVPVLATPEVEEPTDPHLAAGPGAGDVPPARTQGEAQSTGWWQVVTQPIVGPGQPPLARSTGPHGTRPTTGEPYVALTFDDGPDPRYTPQVLALLREYGVTATFCVVGHLAAEFPELIRAIVADGHTMCNHSWDHDMALGSRSRAAIRADLERTTAAIRDAAPGTRVSYYRQPGGNWTARVVDVAEELGMTSLHWAVDPQDWRKPGAAKIAAMVNSHCHPGAIVLLHDGGGEREGTVAALRTILPELTSQFMLAAMPPGVAPPQRYGIELPLRSGQR